MGKKLMVALPAILLALVMVACDDGSGSKSGSIPSELTGFYTGDSYTIEIRGTGRGAFNGTDCTFSAEDGVLTVTMGSQTLTVDYEIIGGAVKFSNANGDGALKAAFEDLIAKSPVTPDKNPPNQTGIPSALVGTWNSTVTVGAFEAGTKFFVINANGSGTTINTTSKADDPCTWSVTGNKLTLSVYYPANPAFGTLRCTFDYAIVGGKLELSNAVPDTTDSIYSGLLSGYVDYFPVGGVITIPEIDDFTWITISTDFVGTWENTGYSWPIFVINTDGTGTVQFGVAAEAPGPCTYKMTADKAKLLLDVGAYGKCMYDVVFSNGGNTFTLSNAVADATGTGVLEAYTYFTPVTRQGSLTIDDFTWITVSTEFVGTWKNIGYTWPIFVINADGTGTVQFGVAAEAPGPCTYQMTADKGKLLLDVGAYGKCMYAISFSNSDNTFTLSGALADATGTGVLEAYTYFTPVTKE